MFGNIIKRHLENNFIAFPGGGSGSLFSVQTGVRHCSDKPLKIFQKKHDIIWINNPHYDNSFLSQENLDKIISAKKHVFISCSNKQTAGILSRKRFETIRVGKEAILDLNKEHFDNSRLKESIRSGLRTGNPVEYLPDNKIAARLEEFKTVCRHANEPQIKHFFNDKLTCLNRLFVFEDFNGLWLGALMLSAVNESIIKTDLLLRRKDAPNGVMEALIYNTFKKLGDEGFKLWSLGEVPYIIYDSSLFSKEYWINLIGRKTRFAYNYYGLFKFKNKFSPDWNDVFICTKRKLNPLLLIKILIESNLMILILYKAFLLIFKSWN